MSSDRAIGLVLAVSVGVVLLLGAGLLWRAHHAPPPAPPATPTPAATASGTATATATAAVPAAARGYRLAGTVVGDVAYAVLERPDGQSDLVRPGQVVRGLGQLIAVEEDRVRIEGETGAFALFVAAAPTVTPAPTVSPTSAPPPPAGPSTSGSSP